MAAGKMRDGLIQRGSTYSYVVRETDPATGIKRNRWVGGFPTREAAKAARDEARTAVRRGTYVAPERMTVGAWLDEWLSSVDRLRKPSTARSYATTVDKYLRPFLGGQPLQAVSPLALTRLWADLQRGGGRGGAPLSARTVQYARSLLRAALNEAVANGRLASNPVSASRLPSRAHVEDDEPTMTVWTPEEQQRFISRTSDHRWSIAWRLALGTGMRRGELAALRWDCVDLDRAAITVRRNAAQVGRTIAEGSPKSRESRRVIPISEGLVTALREWRKRQAAERLAGGLGTDGEDGLVLTWEDGQRVWPEFLSKRFVQDQSGLGLPRLRLHDARHSYASTLIGLGVAPHTVKELMGHSTIAMTDRYTHSHRSHKAEAAAVLGRALGF